MMTRKTIITTVIAIFFIALAVVWSIDTIRAQDTITNTTTNTTTTGDVTSGDSAITTIGGTTTYDASTETIYNVENTTTQTDITEITERGYSVSPNVYLGGYPYGIGYGHNFLAHEDIKKNNRLLVEIHEMLQELDIRIARIEKALGIKSSKVSKRRSSTRPAKKTKIYSTD